VAEPVPVRRKIRRLPLCRPDQECGGYEGADEEDDDHPKDEQLHVVTPLTLAAARALALVSAPAAESRRAFCVLGLGLARRLAGLILRLRWAAGALEAGCVLDLVGHLVVSGWPTLPFDNALGLVTVRKPGVFPFLRMNWLRSAP
jgi:hypothetical protein